MSEPVRATPFAKRRAGIILHPTSLPVSGGACDMPGPASGDLGPQAFHFVDFLVAAGISVWQMLPLGPTHADRSPYQCTSVHAGDSRLISLQRLVDWGWLSPPKDDTRQRTAAWRNQQLSIAYAGFQRQASDADRAAFAEFASTHSAWLDDYALYEALRGEHQQQAWFNWPAPLRDRDSAALDAARQRLTGTLNQVRFNQFVFFRQWRDLREYANQRGVLLFGDMPIFVAYDSAEVWAQRDYFRVDDAGRLEVVAGVPPDYFSATGQRWGNPHYRWERLEADGFRWWVERMRTQREFFDLIRIDHFRGFEAYWEIPAAAETAIEGHWVKAPGERLFQTLQDNFHALPLVAEDLGVITPEVDALRRQFALPGMKILQFAFGGDAQNPYLPHHHEPNSVVYTGTHDNDTTLGWYQALDAQTRDHVRAYFGQTAEPMPWLLIRAALASVAVLAVVPMQDVLALDAEHRMNVPGVAEGNWLWQFDWSMVPANLAERLRQWVDLYGRAPG